MTDTIETIIDLDDLDLAAACDRGYELELTHPVSKKPLGVFISIVGKESETFKGYIRKETNDKLAKDALRSKNGQEPELETMEMVDERGIALLATCTTGWRNVKYKGKDLSYSRENVIKLYTNLSWVKIQVDRAIGNLANFMKG